MRTGNIILIGAMGAGKSTVGKRLAERLGLQFYDSDEVIERKTGNNIATIFEHEGESTFRVYEREVIVELCQQEDIVLATGGGAVLLEDTRELLVGKGNVFYLSASVDTLLDRTSGNSGRPLLQAPDRRQRITGLLRQRAPIYEEMADHIITTDHDTIGQIVEQLVHFMQVRPEDKICLK